MVGLVAGGQFAASLISRIWSGRYADTRGPKSALVVGLVMAVAGGILYLVSLRFVASPRVSVTILLVGRALLGGTDVERMSAPVAQRLDQQGEGRGGLAAAWIPKVIAGIGKAPVR